MANPACAAGRRACQLLGSMGRASRLLPLLGQRASFEKVSLRLRPLLEQGFAFTVLQGFALFDQGVHAVGCLAVFV